MSKFSKDSGPRWVVLIDKNPVGPFSEDEIRQKFEDGEVRPNDIAFKVMPGTSKPGNEWKFLWQFMEFDRRRQVKLPEEPAFSADTDRRALVTTEEARRRVLAELPDEFHDLPTLIADRLPPEPSALGVDVEMQDSDITGRFQPPRARVSLATVLPIVVFAGIAVFLTWVFLSRTMPTETPRVPAAQTDSKH